MIMLLMFALFTSYILQQKKIQAVHETVLSIFAGRRYPQWRRHNLGIYGENNRRKKEVEEELVVEGNAVLEGGVCETDE
jgi:hypothetical protein